MKTKNYNLIPLSIDQGLNAVQIGTAGGYIRLLEAPSTANVFIHLNEKNADPIPLKVYHAIEATNIERIFVTCNAVPGEIIKIVQANSSEDFKMVTPASDVKLSALGSYESVALEQMQSVADNAVLSSTALAQFDKIINPYKTIPLVTVGSINTTGLVTALSKTLTSDKIRITLMTNSSNNGDWAKMYALIDGAICMINFHVTYIGKTLTMEFEGVNGKTLEIRSDGADNGTNWFYLEEFTLK